MRTDIQIGFFDLIILLGIFQGVFLSWFFIRNGLDERRSNLFQGLLLLSLSLVILEELLNNTGIITQVLWLSNYSEPLNFSFSPLLYLYVTRSLYPKKKNADWVHLIGTVIWVFYMTFYFTQPDEVKYNSYISSKHPDWPHLPVILSVDVDPLGIRQYVNEMTALHIIIYLVLSIRVLLNWLATNKQSLFGVRDQKFAMARSSVLHFIIVALVFISVKLYFGNDVGDYFIASYVSIIIGITGYRVLDSSTFFGQNHAFLEFPVMKYQRSALSDSRKSNILRKIQVEMESQKYAINRMASLSGLAQRVHESKHHVSQVINERLGKNFYELLAHYRVEEAKRLMRQDSQLQLTVEEIAERVGYNSKSAFNSAFKKLTDHTPSTYRKNLYP